jgi:hypothetical protein
MTDPINLTQLRDKVERTGGLDYDEALALIDTAEAAQDYLRTNWSHNETPAVRRLRQTLNRYTT